MRIAYLLLVLLLGACSDPTARLLVCQKACKPKPKLTARAVRVRAASDLIALRPGAAYKFVVDGRGWLLVAPLAKKVAGNPYHHAVLAGGEPVRAGGLVFVEHDGRELTRVRLDQRSTSYCPPVETLRHAVKILVAGGVRREVLRVENRPPGCSPRWQGQASRGK